MIKILEIICSIGLLVSTYFCGHKPKVGWFMFFVTNILYAYIMFYKGLIFIGITGIILCIISFRNFVRIK